MHIYQYTVGCFLNFDICAKRASTCITTYINRSRGCHQFILSWYKEPYRELVMDVSELFFYVCNVIFKQRLPGFIHCTGFTVRNSSCGKVRSMFSQMSVCPQGGRCTTSIRQILPPWTDPPPPAADSHCSERYASYWNLFLFFLWNYILWLLQPTRTICILKEIEIKDL